MYILHYKIYINLDYKYLYFFIYLSIYIYQGLHINPKNEPDGDSTLHKHAKEPK